MRELLNYLSPLLLIKQGKYQLRDIYREIGKNNIVLKMPQNIPYSPSGNTGLHLPPPYQAGYRQ